MRGRTFSVSIGDMDKGNTNYNISITAGTVFKTILIGILFLLLWKLRDVVLVVITSIVIASAIEPGARFFEKRKVPRAIGVLLIYIIIFGVLAGLFSVFLPVLLTDTLQLFNTLPNYSDKISLWNPLGQFESLNQLFSVKDIISSLNDYVTSFTSGFFGTLSGLFGGIVSLSIIVILSFYLAVQTDGVADFLKIVTSVNNEKYIIDLWKRSREKIGLWMQGQFILGILIAILTYLGLSIFGVNNALFLAVFAGVMELIPLFGIIISIIPAVTIAILQGGISLGLLVLGLYVIIQQFESNIFYPLVVKKIVGIPPIVSILMLVVGAKLAGFLGILLAVPMTAILLEILSDVEKKKYAK
jgi:predicted PurR-regulated permease PerM